MALLRRKKRTDKLYQSSSSYMDCMTYFNTKWHPINIFGTPDEDFSTLDNKIGTLSFPNWISHLM